MTNTVRDISSWRMVRKQGRVWSNDVCWNTSAKQLAGEQPRNFPRGILLPQFWLFGLYFVLKKKSVSIRCLAAY